MGSSFKLKNKFIYMIIAILLGGCGEGGGSSNDGGSSNGGGSEVVKPTISVQPSDAEVYQGQAATFAVTAQSGTLAYQWYKNNEAISGATTSTYTTLSLPLSDNAAEYYVLISNSGSNVKSNVARLTIKSAPASKLNDTGISANQCLSNNVLVNCSSTTADSQDGQIGRDVTANDDTDGKAGFSFIKISSTGAELANSASSWSCVKDMTTGLMWEVKTSANKNDTFTNYDDINSNQKYVSTDNTLVKPSQSDLDQATNSVGYKNSINSSKLCGFSDWRIPTLEELQGLVIYGSSAPMVDTNWFPNSVSAVTWSSSSATDGYVWITDFSSGKTWSWARNQTKSIRLVRGALPSADRFSYALDTDGTTPIVVDLHTKLIWRRCLEGQTWSNASCSGSNTDYSFSEALTHAKAEADAKGKKWRLPNAKELISVGSNIDTLFPGNITGNTSIWSATPYLITPKRPLLMRQGWGYLDSWYDTASVRLVRDNE